MLRFKIDNLSEMRQLDITDAKELFSVVDANRAHLRKWLPWLDMNTEEEHSRAYIRSTLEQYRSKKGFVCGIFFRGRLVGTCGYLPINDTDRGVTIGYWLSEDAMGNGLVTRATSILLNYAFDELGLSRVNIPVAVGNRRSRSICESLGLESEGIKKDAEELYGVYVDHVLYYTTPEIWHDRVT